MDTAGVLQTKVRNTVIPNSLIKYMQKLGFKLPNHEQEIKCCGAESVKQRCVHFVLVYPCQPWFYLTGTILPQIYITPDSLWKQKSVLSVVLVVESPNCVYKDHLRFTWGWSCLSSAAFSSRLGLRSSLGETFYYDTIWYIRLGMRFRSIHSGSAQLA